MKKESKQKLVERLAKMLTTDEAAAKELLPTLQKIVDAEDITDAELDLIDAKVSPANRAKWEKVLAVDGKFTEQFSSKGHNAGQAKAYAELKKQFATDMGMTIDEAAEEFTDNAKFRTAYKKYVEAKTKPADGKTAEDTQKAIDKAVEDAKKTLLEDANKRETTLIQEWQGKLNKTIQSQNVQTTLLNAVAGKKIKGGLSPEDILLVLQTKLTNGYKLSFNEQNTLDKILGSDGHEIDNAKKDGKLTKDEIISSLVANYLEKEEEGEGQKDKNGEFVASKKTELSGEDAYQEDMNSRRE